MNKANKKNGWIKPPVACKCKSQLYKILFLTLSLYLVTIFYY